MEHHEHAKSVGYWELVKRNPHFRRVWTAQLVSELGDWLNFVALVQLLHTFSGSAQAVGWLIVIQMLPLVVVGPIGGIIADRFNRCVVMIAADVLRAVVVLGFLTIHRADQLWLVYVLAGLQFSVTAFFEPARSAMLPMLAEGEELVTANALTSLSWSVMLAVGGAVGGVIAGVLGNTAAFWVDAATFVSSACLLWPLIRFGRVNQGEKTTAKVSDGRMWSVLKFVVQGPWNLIRAFVGGLRPALSFLADRPHVVAVLLIKSGICLTAGSVWLLSVVYGQRIFPIGQDGAFSVGLLNSVHGLGAVIGAVLTGRFLRVSKPISVVWWAFALRGVFFYIWATASGLGQVSIAILGITACGSLLWVVSTTLLQKFTPDEIRGRIFAVEQSLMTFALMISTHGLGWAMDHRGMAAWQGAMWTAGAAGVIALGWAWVWTAWPRWTAADAEREQARLAPAQTIRRRRLIR